MHIKREPDVMSKKTITGNILLLAVSLLVTTLLAEIILRHVNPVDAGKSGDFRIPHPVLGWVLEPGASYLNPMQETTVPVTYNSMGWRDFEHTVENPDNVTRILVLGDSYMEAYSVHIEDALPSRLRQLALENDKVIEVINLGVGGYGTLQEYLAFQHHGKQYRPDIVLLGFYLSNDVRNNSYALESLMTPKEMKTNSRPFLDPDRETEWKLTMVDFENAQVRFREARKERETTRKTSKGSSLFMEIMKLSGKINSNHTEESPLDDKSSKEARHLAHHGVNYCQEPPEFSAAWDITQRILLRLNREVMENGGRLLVFSVPAMHEVDTGRMNKVLEKTPKTDLLCLDGAPGYARLAGILKELQIEFIDLLPVFREKTQGRGGNLFRGSDRHWNEAGHQLAAEQIMSALNRYHMLEPPNSQEKKVQMEK